MNQSVTLTWTGSNCNLAKDEPTTDLTFIFDWADKQLTVVAGELPAEERTVYFVTDGKENWDKVYAHVWNPEFVEWPSVQMTLLTTNDESDVKIWQCTFSGVENIPEEGVSWIKFNNGNRGEGNESSEFLFHENSGYGMNKSTASLTDMVSDVVQPVEYYNLQGIKVVSPEKGIYIMRRGNEVRKVIM